MEVDTELGTVDVLRYVAVHDCGQVINPMLLTGQIEGGISMGLGQALFEDMKEDPETGRLINNSFTDYLLPTSMDMPLEMKVDFLQTPDEDGPSARLASARRRPARCSRPLRTRYTTPSACRSVNCRSHRSVCWSTFTKQSGKRTDKREKKTQINCNLW